MLYVSLLNLDCTTWTCRVFFFFSSRRRHTRCSRDWSSGVCSSDLNRMHVVTIDGIGISKMVDLRGKRVSTGRSEERRVGKGVDLGGRRIIKKKKRKKPVVMDY